MMKIAVGSQNSHKIEAVKKGIEEIYQDFRIEGFKTDSGVADQPWGDEEILKGAYNRAFELAGTQTGFDFYIGAEGGLVQKHGLVYDYAYIVILRNDGTVGISRTSEFLLPEIVAQRVLNGEELGPVLDEFFKGSTNEAVHDLTNGAIDRAKFYTPAVVLAMSRFINPDWYQDPKI